MALAGHISFVVITAALMVSGYDVLPLVFDRLPLDIQDDPDFLRGLAWDNRDQNSDIITRGSSAKGEVNIFYENQDKNMSKWYRYQEALSVMALI